MSRLPPCHGHGVRSRVGFSAASACSWPSSLRCRALPLPGAGKRRTAAFPLPPFESLPFYRPKQQDTLFQGVLLFWRRGWDSNPRDVSAKLISSPTGYKQMCIICGHSCPPCCTQRKPCLQGFSDYITKIAPRIRTHKIFSKKRLFEHVGQTSGRFRADIKPAKQPYGQVYCRDIPSS